MDQKKQWYQSQRALPESSTNSTTHTNRGDWQEEVYQKIIVMKEKYLPELSELYQKTANKLQQHESLPQPPNSDSLAKLKMFKPMLDRLITVLQVSKSNISPGLKEKLGIYEKQIINFINTNRPRKTVSSLHLPPPEMHNAHLLQQPKMEQQDSNDHVIYLNFLSPTTDTSGTDWQEEVYQKIQVMKETYLPELSEMFQKIDNKLQEYESVPPQSNPDKLEKLKVFRTMLAHLITVLQVSKSSISPGLKEKLGLYEKQIINFNKRFMKYNNGSPPQGGEPAMDAGDWRNKLQADSRQRIVNKIMDTLKRHLPFSGQEGLHELKKIAVRFEQKIYTAATSQSDYLRKISLKMLTMETKSQTKMANSLQSNSAAFLDSPALTGHTEKRPIKR